MSGNKVNMTPLESRKRMLIAKSELTRDRVVEAWDEFAESVAVLAARTQSGRSLADVIMPVATGLGGAVIAAAPGLVWLKKIVHGARVATTLWQILRPRRDAMATLPVRPAS